MTSRHPSPRKDSDNRHSQPHHPHREDGGCVFTGPVDSTLYTTRLTPRLFLDPLLTASLTYRLQWNDVDVCAGPQVWWRGHRSSDFGLPRVPSTGPPSAAPDTHPGGVRTDEGPQVSCLSSQTTSSVPPTHRSSVERTRGVNGSEVQVQGYTGGGLRVADPGGLSLTPCVGPP